MKQLKPGKYVANGTDVAWCRREGKLSPTRKPKGYIVKLVAPFPIENCWQDTEHYYWHPDWLDPAEKKEIPYEI